MSKRSIIVSKYSETKYREILDPSNFDGGTRTEKYLGETRVFVDIYDENEVTENNLKSYYRDDNYERYVIYEEKTTPDSLFLNKIIESLNVYCKEKKHVTLYIDNLKEDEIAFINEHFHDKISIRKKTKRNRSWNIKF